MRKYRAEQAGSARGAGSSKGVGEEISEKTVLDEDLQG